MSNCTGNALMRNHRGKLGGVIYRSWGKETIASKAPNMKGHKWSKAQKANRRRFSEAMAYARRVLDDPGMYLYYRKKAKRKQTIWNVAVADYMKQPKLCSIRLCKELDESGHFIKVDADDNYQVTSVIVTILNALGLVVGSGNAIENNDGEWIYNLSMPMESIQGGRVEVSVRDLPGNVVMGCKLLDGS